MARLEELAALDRFFGDVGMADADGLGTRGIMRQSGKSRNAVNRWRARFQAEDIDGLMRDKTRPSRIPPLAEAVPERTVALTLTDPPGETTHWTATVMAR